MISASTGRGCGGSDHATGAGGLAAFERAGALARLAEESFDVLVIGGGITGAGVALDAASRGLRTALIDKGDFASGTSSKSSKMVHGGLRYLQQHEFRLVYENLAERQRLLENAPHLVSPLPFLIPLFGRGGAVAKAVARSYATALWIYDVTGGVRIGSRHRRVSRSEALAHLPTLQADRLEAGFLYSDARADDARLTLAVARTAVVDHGAVGANYLAAESLCTDEAGRVVGAIVRSTLPGPLSAKVGRAGPGGRGEPTFAIAASVVVNATGVWADEVRALDEGTHPHSIRPAKGIHVTVPASRLPCDIASVIPVRGDRRSIFVVPWPEGELTYIGTTDTAYEGPLDDPGCTEEDVDYLLSAVNAVTSSELTRSDVTGVWAGLRPLLDPGEGHGPVSERTADLSRRHTVRTSPSGVVTVTGGKLTTYRKMAQDTVDEVVRHLTGPGVGTGDTLGAVPRSITKSLRLRGAPAGRPGRTRPGPAGAAGQPSSPVAGGTAAAVDSRELRARLEARYGTEAGDVLALCHGRPELAEPIVGGLPYIGAEVLYGVRAEMACTLEDVLSRRTRALLQRAAETAEAALGVARLVGDELGWSDETVEAQARAVARKVKDEMARAGIPLLAVRAAGAEPGEAR